ncbi:hypothetical protein [Streptomyces sp. SCL15-4]|uniref:hypothetical protein n=1 Tax=Streptomyces sp. SCL15-4 TaxID=2967221 RepID=UPI00296750A4|nr:hypothetical protein [Streptomyces sp. SCL15-4]
MFVQPAGVAGAQTDRRVVAGDVIRVTGSKDTVEAGNGYGDWNLTWSEWLAHGAGRPGGAAR